MEQEMLYYFVDTENIKDNWAKLLPLQENEKVLLFYSPNSPGVSYSLLDTVFQNQQQMELIACHTGHNAMDFQLVSELGYRMGQNPLARCVICSNDQGYDPVCKYWSDRGRQVERREFRTPKQVRLSGEKPKPGIQEAPRPAPEAEKPQKPQNPQNPLQETKKLPAPQEQKKLPAPQEPKKLPLPEKKQEQPKPAPKPQNAPAPEKAAAVTQALKKAFPAELVQYVEPTAQIILAHGKDDMAKIYQGYLRKYGQKKGLEVYKKLRTYVRSACKTI